MPIDIKEDRRLRVTWFKYQHILADMNNHYNRKKFIQNQMDTNKLSQWEATLVFEEEVKKVDRQRREEMSQIRKQFIAEKKEKEEEDERTRVAALEEIRNVRKMRKEERESLPPPPVRRSARINRKTTDVPIEKFQCGSVYKTNITA